MTLTSKPFKQSSKADASGAAPSTSSVRAAANASTVNAPPIAPAAQHLAPPTPRDTPNPPIPAKRPIQLAISDSEEEDVTGVAKSPVEATRAKANSRAVHESATAPAGPSRRVPLAIEREVDELRIAVTAVESKLESNEDKTKREFGTLRAMIAQMEATIAALTTTVDTQNATIATLQANANAPVRGVAPLPAPAAEVLTPVEFDPLIDHKSYVPVSDDETIATLLRTFKHRGNDEKPDIPERRLIMELLRGAVWDTLDGVTKASDVKPPVFDHAGKHILFPSEFADSKGHIKAFPDWNAKITTQVPFVSMVLRAFRGRAPKNGTVVSVTARLLKEELILEMFMDGPWKTCVSNYKKTPEEAKEIGKNLRGKKRLERKSDDTLDLINEELPDLAGEEFAALTHPGFLSGEESDPDNKGGLIVNQHDARSTWLNNFSDARYARRQQRAASQPGYQLKERRTVPVPFKGLPELRRGNKVIKTPLFFFNAAWRKANREYIDANTHLIDTSLTRPPDISTLLEKYPRTTKSPSKPPSHKKEPNQQELRGGDSGDEGEDEGDGDEGPEDKNEDEGEEKGENNKETEGGDSHMQVEIAGKENGEGSGNGSIEDNMIDPKLLQRRPGPSPTSPAPKSRPKVKNPTDVAAEPAPVSAFRIKIKAFNAPITPLPKPCSKQKSRSPSPEAAPPAPLAPSAPAPAAEPEPVAMPIDGPQYPPPNLPVQSLVDTEATVGSASNPKKKGGRAARGKKSEGEMNEVALGTAAGQSTLTQVPVEPTATEPVKRKRGRPRKT